jgi:E3 ubiquitin-protein ligase DOA10
MTESRLITDQIMNLPEIDEKNCRICLAEGTINNMISPCHCIGSIGYIHEKCFISYFDHKYNLAEKRAKDQMEKRLNCEICKE